MTCEGIDFQKTARRALDEFYRGERIYREPVGLRELVLQKEKERRRASYRAPEHRGRLADDVLGSHR